ncbi:MAG: hypothetical protein AAFP78_12570, partial [Pseudomonadota bacterium]
GNDVLTGGGGADRFLFARNDGRDFVRDFQDGRDKIVIQNGASDFDDLQISQLGGDAVFAFAGTTVRLDGVRANQLDADDFVFQSSAAAKPEDDGPLFADDFLL